MKLSHEEIQKLAKTFKMFNMNPPQTALYAFSALQADEALTESIAERFTMDGQTVWALTGITDKSLIRVRGSSACESWSWSSPGSEEDRKGENVGGTLWPLSALRSLKVEDVGDATWQGDSRQHLYDAAWVVTLRGGDEVSVPACKTMPNQVDSERVESLMAVIRTHI